MNKTKQNQFFKLTLPLVRYPEEVITLSCYKFLDEFYFKFSGDSKKMVVEVLTRNDEKKADKKSFEKDFYTELNHNLVRLHVARDNKKLREMIVFQSFFSALPEEEKERTVLKEKKIKKSNFKFKDPLGIAVPWEEKYGQNNSKKKPRK